MMQENSFPGKAQADVHKSPLKDFSPSPRPEENVLNMDMLFESLDVPEGQSDEGSVKIVVFNDKTRIQIERLYYITDMMGESYSSAFNVNMNGVLVYSLDRKSLLIKFPTPRPIEIAGFRQDVPISRSRGERKALEIKVPYGRQEEVGKALVDWTIKSIGEGTVTEPPYK